MSRFFIYLRRVIDWMKEGFGKVVKYVSTPLHALTLIIIAFLGTACLREWPIEILYILIGLAGVSAVILLICILFSPRRLQFTGEEHIIWARERLGDSEMRKAYWLGQDMGKQENPAIEDKRGKVE